ncbi:hypothetical protein KC318_g8670 [Hortaea werneckii]|nr:hypothetical protein KC334_g5919 [Hortaea werneckii]KAI7004429.1 hypothetical protein KC355_g8730 [Hortaea werneckii]KAI7662810.1 hypothetical protein KC318_g8670 [Hortaea werneckii]
MALQGTESSAANLEKLRWCRQLSLAMKAEEALEAFLTNTKDLHMGVSLKDAANIVAEIGTTSALEAKIRNVYWFVTANEIVRTAKVDAKRYNLQTIAGRMKDEEG